MHLKFLKFFYFYVQLISPSQVLFSQLVYCKPKSQTWWVLVGPLFQWGGNEIVVGVGKTGRDTSPPLVAGWGLPGNRKNAGWRSAGCQVSGRESWRGRRRERLCWPFMGPRDWWQIIWATGRWVEPLRRNWKDWGVRLSGKVPSSIWLVVNLNSVNFLTCGEGVAWNGAGSNMGCSSHCSHSSFLL